MLFSFCSYQKKARGPNNEIFVLATEKTRDVIGTAIDTSFAYGMLTPVYEQFFITKWFPIEKFAPFSEYKNLIVVADIDDGGVGNQIAKGILPKEKYEAAANDSVFIYSFEDLWAEGQTFILIAGTDLEAMKQNVLEQKAWIYQKFNQRYIRRYKEIVYRRGEEEQLSRKLWNKYRWTLRIQDKWMQLQEHPESKFIWLGAANPYRWVSVSWADGIITEWMTANGLFDKRQEIGKYYGEISTDTKYLSHIFTNFGKWDALKMSGMWYHNTETKGGAFTTYAFYDNHSDRTYVVDMMIWNPGAQVMTPFRQMEIMASTFTTNPEKNQPLQ